MDKELQKAIIRAELLDKAEWVTLPEGATRELLQIVLDESPTIASTIETLRFWADRCIVVYNKTDASEKESLCADTIDTLETIIQNSIRKYKSEVYIAVGPSVDVESVIANFESVYGGYYSNLINIRYCTYKLTNIQRMILQIVFRYRIGRVKLTMMETAVNQKIKELGQTLFCYGMSDETKAFIAHNYLAQTVEYWLDENAKPLERSYMQSAYGAFINRKCVCQGYAEAYKRILDSQNIPCEVIVGKIKGSPNYHAWNVVSFNQKEYYHIDVTWDAQRDGAERYRYYGLRDEDLRSARLWTKPFNLSCDGQSNILATAQQQLAQNGSEFALKGADKKYFK